MYFINTPIGFYVHCGRSAANTPMEKSFCDMKYRKDGCNKCMFSYLSDYHAKFIRIPGNEIEVVSGGTFIYAVEEQVI